MRDYYDVLGVRRMRERTRSSGPTASSLGATIPTSRATTVRLRFSKSRAPTKCSRIPDRRRSYDASLASSQRRESTGSPTRSRSISRPSPASSTACGIRFSASLPHAQLAAEVELTPQEAFWGALVPLLIPLRATCADCGGRGEVWEEWCDACAGSGEVLAEYPLRLRVPAGVRSGLALPVQRDAAGMAPAMIEVSITVR